MPSLKPKQKSKKTELSLWGLGISIDYAELTKSEAKKVIKNGIRWDRFMDLVWNASSGSECGPTNVTLFVNGEEVAKFDIDKHPIGSKKPFKLGKKGKYYLVNQVWEEGEWRKLSISGTFDQSKLEVNAGSDDLNGFVFTYFYVSYDGKDLESRLEIAPR